MYWNNSSAIQFVLSAYSECPVPSFTEWTGHFLFFYFDAGNLKELFKDTIRLNTSFSGVES